MAGVYGSLNSRADFRRALDEALDFVRDDRAAPRGLPARTVVEAQLDAMKTWTESPKRALPAVFAFVGTCDPVLDDTRRLEAALSELHAAHEVRYYPGEHHAFHALLMRRAARDCWRDKFAHLKRVLASRRRSRRAPDNRVLTTRGCAYACGTESEKSWTRRGRQGTSRSSATRAGTKLVSGSFAAPPPIAQ